MSFIGNVPAEAYSPVAKDTFSGNDSTTDFTLSVPATTNSVEVLVENVQQEPTTAYTISGTTLSFTAAPVTGTNNIYVIHRGPAVQTVVPPAGVAIDASTVTASGLVTAQDGLVVDNDGATVATFDRATSHGSIIDLQKDGTTLGSITTRAGDVIQISSAGTNSGLDFAGGINPVYSGSLSDNQVDIGYSAYRFKDLYLSGGVYLGGTTATNKLDDFETGTWTPTIQGSNTSGTYTPSFSAGVYTKIGDLVCIEFSVEDFSTASGGSGYIKITGMPFNKANNGTFSASSLMYQSLSLPTAKDVVVGWNTYAESAVMLVYALNDFASRTTVSITGVGTTTEFSFAAVYKAA